MTNKLDVIKPGDRVRVTFEGDVKGVADCGTGAFILDGGHARSFFTPKEVNAPTFHIERIEKPLEVGDRVRLLRNNAGYAGNILAIAEGMAWVRYDLRSAALNNFHDTEKVSDLERIP